MLLMPLVPHTNHMINQHPITPPTELVSMWRDLLASRSEEDVLIFATQWGADQELEACCKWLPKLPPWSADDLRRHRRPKPPSLRKQAYDALDTYIYGALDPKDKERTYNTIRRALEALRDD